MSLEQPVTFLLYNQRGVLISKQPIQSIEEISVLMTSDQVWLNAAHLSSKNLWLHHPVIGDASFDDFERLPCNPIHTGYEKFEWPVNDFLLCEEATGDFYAYITEYPYGYWGRPDGSTYIRETGYRSADSGKSWQLIGPLMEPSAAFYEGDGTHPGGATGDFHVCFADGRYHVIFGWCDLNNRDGGEGYAWAEKPGGPYQRTANPVHSELHSPRPNEKLHRLYAAGVFRRQNDWILLAMMSTPGNAGGYWALVGATAEDPAGPYSTPFVLLSPDSLIFHHPLMEFFPYFQHDGYLYATATSVACNRTYQGVWRAPIEQAHQPEAWQFVQDGSAWSWYPSDYEACGLWGQTFSRVVTADGTQYALYPSKTAGNVGTISLAKGTWMGQREQGFRLSAPNAPAMTFLMQTYAQFELHARLKIYGSGALLLGHDGVMCSDRNTADAVPHPVMLNNVTSLKIDKTGLTLEQAADGQVSQLAKVERELDLAAGDVSITAACDGETFSVAVNGQALYNGAALPAGLIGVLADRGSYIDVESFEVSGQAAPAQVAFLSFEGLLGSAAFPGTFEMVEMPSFRYGMGHILTAPGARAKWNYFGKGMSLWAPCGSGYGQARLWVDGRDCGMLDFSARPAAVSAACYSCDLPEGYHAVLLECLSGRVPVDCIIYSR